MRSGVKVILLLVLLTGCSGRWHIERAKKKGVLMDSVFTEVITPIHTSDTVTLFKGDISVDTLFVNTTRWRSRTLIRRDTVWQEITCLPDTVRVLTQVDIKCPPRKGFPKWLVWPLVGGAFLGGLFLRAFIKSLLK